jgi:hypothetical protein
MSGAADASLAHGNRTGGFSMREISLTAAIAAAILIAPAPPGARATPVGAASSVAAALASVRAVQDTAYVCRHGSASSRRMCWWRSGFRGWRRQWRRRR